MLQWEQQELEEDLTTTNSLKTQRRGSLIREREMDNGQLAVASASTSDLARPSPRNRSQSCSNKESFCDLDRLSHM